MRKKTINVTYCLNCSKDLSHRPRSPIYCNSNCRVCHKHKIKQYIKAIFGIGNKFECKNCRKTFFTKIRGRVYCSRKCQKEYLYYGRLAEHRCPRCGRKKTTQAEIDRSICNKCSQDYKDYSNSKRKAQKQKSFNYQKDRFCLYCERNINYKKINAQFCTHNHYILYHRYGRERDRFNHGKINRSTRSFITKKLSLKNIRKLSDVLLRIEAIKPKQEVAYV